MRDDIGDQLVRKFAISDSFVIKTKSVKNKRGFCLVAGLIRLYVRWKFLVMRLSGFMATRMTLKAFIRLKMANGIRVSWINGF